MRQLHGQHSFVAAGQQQLVACMQLHMIFASVMPGALDLKPDEFQAAFASGVVGALTASQQVLPSNQCYHIQIYLPEQCSTHVALTCYHQISDEQRWQEVVTCRTHYKGTNELRAGCR